MYTYSITYTSTFLLVIGPAGHVTISGYDLSDFGKCLQHWSRSAQTMLEQCEQLGIGTRCLPVYYERLVLDAERTMRRVLRFLGLPWDNTVLHHQDFVAAAGAAGDAQPDHKIILSKSLSPYFFLN